MAETPIIEDKVKNLIIEILAGEWPLTAKKIYHKIKKKGKTVSYQAVFKSLQQLVDQKVVKKKQYNYSLDEEWVTEKADFYDGIKKKYLGDEEDYERLILKNRSITFKFKNIYRFYSIFLGLLGKLNYLTKKEDYIGYGDVRNLYWTFFKGEKEKKLLDKFFSSYNEAYILCKNKNKGNMLIREDYKSYNKNFNINFNNECATECDTIIGGDYVVQIYYSKEFNETLDKLFSEIENRDAESLNKLGGLLFSKKVPITMIVTKNKDLTKIKKQRIRREFGLKS